MKVFSPFHMVTLSPWPMLSGFGAFLLLLSSASLFFWGTKVIFSMIFSILFLLMVTFCWWRDVIREASFEGSHTFKVSKNMKIGMMWFIFSEVMFFFGFFWSFFHYSLSPDLNIGCIWPPIGISPLNPFQIPLLNTLILVSSGITATWAHHNLLIKNSIILPMVMTLILGFSFILLQFYEYNICSFSMSDSVYGSVFFITTGFHGLHVLVGSIFLLVCFFRLINLQVSSWHHFGFEASLWYWHFVDVVWLFLFFMVYCWGS